MSLNPEMTGLLERFRSTIELAEAECQRAPGVSLHERLGIIFQARMTAIDELTEWGVQAGVVTRKQIGEYHDDKEVQEMATVVTKEGEIRKAVWAEMERWPPAKKLAFCGALVEEQRQLVEQILVTLPPQGPSVEDTNLGKPPLDVE